MFDVTAALRAVGLPAADAHDLPDSTQRFPDGAHYRFEVAGVETVAAMEAVVDESRKRRVPIHRVIATVGGATLLTMAELREFAALSQEAGIEVIMGPSPSRGWDTGRQLVTPEGFVSGYRVRGTDNLNNLLRDIDRCLDAGIRGFLIVDEGLLELLAELRAKGVLPAETVLKVSVFAGHGNPAGARLLERLGANTFNPLADLSPAMLAAIRQAVSIPMDVYTALVDAMGGFCRFWEADLLARVCAPCYFKIEPGESETKLYKPWQAEFHPFWCREKVKMAAIISELIERKDDSIIRSDFQPADLTLCRP